MTSCCKAVIQEGPRRGASCQFPPQEDGYCGRHKRNKEYDELVAAGKQPCRFFFRGCNTLTESANTACSTCRAKKQTTPCKHDGCRNNSKENGYCGKHERDVYRDQEKTLGIRYCDIARGCFKVCDAGFASCRDCLNATNASARALYEERSIHNLAMAAEEATVLCCYCGKTFEKFQTRYGHQSRTCPSCTHVQQNADAKRTDRVRNFSAEKYKNIERAMTEYRRNASIKGRQFALTQDEFTALVVSPCHYCEHYMEGEIVGIDRVENTVGYTKENCVSACWVCNRMKHSYMQQFFIEHCHSIISKTRSVSYTQTWRLYHKQKIERYSKYRHESINDRGLQWELDRDFYDAIQIQPCYICNYDASIVGIDRKDPTKGYTRDNSMPCCTPCNLMKGELTYDDFLQQVRQITAHHQQRQPSSSDDSAGAGSADFQLS